MIAAQGELAGEGIFAQPEGAASLAAVKTLVREGRIRREETVVSVVTGGGLKYGAAFQHHRFDVLECALPALEGCLSSIL